MSKHQGSKESFTQLFIRLSNLHPELKEPISKQLSGNNVQHFLSSLFIDPKYTIAVARVFRPYVPAIITHVVEKMNYGTSASSMQDGFDKITTALSKILPLFPNDTLRCLSLHFSKGTPLIDRISQFISTNPSAQDKAKLVELIKIAFRLLHFAPQEFSKKWNWSCFFSLVSFPDEEVQWYASRCITSLLQIERSASSLFPTQHKKFLQADKLNREWEEGESLSAENNLMFFNEVTLLDSLFDEQTNLSSKHHLDITQQQHPLQSNSMVEICGVWLPKRQSTKEKKEQTSSPNNIIYTKTTIENLRLMCMAISQSQPVLLEGITGSGKTAFVEHLAHLTDNQLIKVNLDESFDSKDLLGTYVCTDVPGEFKWQPGALTKAVIEGKWILIEDIDLAPFDIVTCLIPLIESNALFLPSRDEVIPATPGFQLFATQSLVETFSGSASRQRNLPMSNLWNRIVIEKLPIPEIKTVLTEKYSNIQHVIPKFIETYEVLRGTLIQKSIPAESVPEHEENSKEMAQLRSFGRFFSFRDLLKWCERVYKLYASKLTQKEYIVSHIKEDIFREGVDLFCGMVVKKSVAEAVIKRLAQVWEVPLGRIQHLSTVYKPIIKEAAGNLTVGRITLAREKNLSQVLSKKHRFAHTKQSLQLLERIAVSVRMNEPVLLTGETGTGKTSIVQYLATLMGRKMIVHNLNQQTDSADFIGGYKPIDIKILATSLKSHFEKLFSVTFSVKQNGEFLSKVIEQYDKKNWKGFTLLLNKVIEKAKEKCSNKVNTSEKKPESAEERRPPAEDESPAKSRKVGKDEKLMKFWSNFEEAVAKFNRQYQLVKNSFAFSFVEGSLVKALKEGHWILLDEINLASTETLERLSSLLEGEEGTLFITEKGDTEPVVRHPNFRLFACMNPPTDIGKKNLPPALRNRFSEYYVHELVEREDLKIVVNQYLERFISHPPTDKIVDFYLEARKQAETNLSDGANQKPHYSLRTLARALEYSTLVLSTYGLERALYEGFSMGFLTLLSRSCYPIMEEMIKKHFVPGVHPNVLTQEPRRPGEDFAKFEHFWLKKGQFPVEESASFILTPSVKEHLKNIARVISASRYPILLQGPTSSGKTSMVNYLAKKTGHRFVRINNHESTDLQEYFGTYITNAEGKLVFKEGILVEAVRNGYWIVLDELNLAPSDILEALNRLLDDNRELFIPETQEVIKPHPHFMLFATQNPPGLYGGRKMLSRAFRNRFQEIHVDDIPSDELETILQQRCGIPRSYANKLVAIMQDLQRYRQSSKIFAGKHGFITPRDLFRWAERKAENYQQLAESGYALLAERLRRDDEKELVKQTIEKYMKVKLDLDAMYNSCESTPEFKMAQELLAKAGVHFPKIVWTRSMKRLFTLVGNCLKFKEPVLLVGETGCGKTTVCQLYSLIYQQMLHIINCHQHTETSDFLGSLRPVRGRELLMQRLKTLISDFEQTALSLDNATVKKHLEEVNKEDIHQCVRKFDKICSLLSQDGDDEDVEMEKNAEISKLTDIQVEIRKIYQELKALFLWYDGPLVQAMKQGDMFLIDEISLAEDAVLERLNSVLEPDRTLVLPEKGSEAIEEIIAKESFRIMATMNPGGDFGKRELSPALRNRFTEIYVPLLSVREDLAIIVRNRLVEDLKEVITTRLVEFIEFFKNQKTKRPLSIRDVISWIDFANMAYSKLKMKPSEAYLHGVELVILEGLGIGTDVSEKLRTGLRKDCVDFLVKQFDESERENLFQTFSVDRLKKPKVSPRYTEASFGMDPFFIDLGGSSATKKIQYTLEAPTTSNNVMKVLRAMQLPKPLLLEGSPGVGKTSLMQAIAKATGHNIVRINLSEQTDMMDLLGTDLPVEGSSGGEFQWSDGIFLRALKAGDWVLLDELNLASQSVLEGLNSVLDHRAEIFIPELNKTFACPKSFRIFACQNPLQQGGGRKGLPKSFLNRFTQIYVDELKSDDLLFIAMAMHGELGEDNLKKMIKFNELMHVQTMVEYKFGRKGSPWEFNLRDVFRWCELLKSDGITESSQFDPAKYIDCIYMQRMRTVEDRLHVAKLYEDTFGTKYEINHHPTYSISPSHVQFGHTVLARHVSDCASNAPGRDIVLLQNSLQPLETIAKCVQMNYMCILTGSTATGKTSIVKLVAQLTGNTLNEFAMTSSTDTVELLGGFEQVDPMQRSKKIARILKESIDTVARTTVLNKNVTSKANIEKVKELYNLWALYSTADQNQNQEPAQTIQMLESITQELHNLNKTVPFSFNHSYITSQLSQINALLKEGVKGRFEWNDGILIKALESGQWVLIDNVNFCNPTVLDRLNSLLEPGGILVVNERGLVDGEVKIVKPHPNFRIFMAMDPKYGEISRAMRNRGVEIALNPIPIPSHDALALLARTELPSAAVGELLMAYHAEYTKNIHMPNDDDKPTIRDLLRAAETICNEISHGLSVEKAIMLAVESIYIRNKSLIENQRLSAVNILKNTVQAYKSKKIESHSIPSTYLLRTSFETADPQFRNLMRQGAYVYFMLSRILTNEILQSTQIKKALSEATKSFVSKFTSASHWEYLLSELPTELVSIFSGNDFREVPSFSTEPSADILHKLRYALQYFVEMCSPADLDLRKLWLKRLLSIVTPLAALSEQVLKTKELMEQYFIVLQQIFENPLSKEVTKDRQAISNPSMKEVALMQPLSMEFNVDFHDKVKYTHALPERNQTARYEVLALKLPTDYTEKKYYEEKEKENFVEQQASLLHQSYWYSLNAKQRSRASVDIVPLFYPLLQSVDELLSTYIKKDLQVPSQAVKAILQARNKLWTYLSSNKQISEEFLIYWNWLIKSLSDEQIVTCKAPEYTHLVNLVKDVDRHSNKLFDNIGKKNYLWKFGGKPKVVQSQELRETIKQIEESANQWQRGDVDTGDLLIKGMSMVDYVNDQGVKVDPKAMESLNDIKSALKKVKEIVKNDSSRSTREGLEKYLDNTFREIAAIDKSNTSTKQSLDWTHFSDAALIPLYDHNSMTAELTIIQALTSLTVSTSKHGADAKAIHKAVAELAEKCSQFIREALKKSSRSPLDLIPYQVFVWKFASQEENSVVEFINKSMPALIQDITFRFNTRLWKSSFNEVPELTSTENLLQVSAENLAGPSKLFQDIKTTKIVQLLKDWQQVPIRARFSKIEQMKQIVEFLLSSSESSEIEGQLPEHDWRYGVNTLSLTLLSFERSFSAQEFGELIEAVLALLAYNGRQVSDPVLMKSFERLIKSSSDERLKASGDYIMECLKHLLDKSGQYDEMTTRGRFWAYLGIVRLSLVAPSQPLDPTLKYSVILSHLKPSLQQLGTQFEMYKQIEAFITGDTTNHQIATLQQEKSQIETLMAKVEGKVVVRPANVSFKELYRDLRQFLTSLVEKNKIITLIDMLLNHSKTTSGTVEEMLVKEEVWQANATQFVNKLMNKYAGYEDILVPFISCVYQLKYGMRILCFGSISAHLAKSSKIYVIVKDLTQSMLEFPSSNNIQSILSHASILNDFLETNSKTIAKYDQYDIALRVLKVLLSKIYLHVYHSNAAPTKDIINVADILFAIYTRVWSEVKEEYEEKKRKEEDLFKYKEKTTHIETEEEALEQEMTAMFPSYSEEYDQYVPTEKEKFLGTAPVPKPKAASQFSATVEKLHKLFENFEEVEYLKTIHQYLFSRSPQPQSDTGMRIRLFEEAFKAANFIITKSSGTLTATSDNLPLVAYGSISLDKLSERLVAKGHAAQGGAGKMDKPYDVYSDSNIPEVTVAFNVIYELVERFVALLKRYEEHPLLIQLVQIGEHVLNQPINSPIMKLLAGIEVLMKKAIEWQETITSPAASIETEIRKLTSLVLRWRKLELDNWRSIYTIKSRVNEQKTHQWWFKLYRLLNLSTFDLSSGSEESPEQNKKTIEGQFFLICDDLLRSATFGEFKARIQLLEMFLNQHSTEKSMTGINKTNIPEKSKEKIVNILRNICRFYGQFVAKIESSIATSSKPLEEKLMNFVKITKWEDLNYDSVRTNSLKARRKLGKFSKKYDEILSQAAKNTWQMFEVNYDDEDAQKSKKKTRKSKKGKQQAVTVPSFGLLQKLAKLSKELVKPSALQLQSAALHNILFGLNEDQESCLNASKLESIISSVMRIADKFIVNGPASKEGDTVIPYVEELSTEIIQRAKVLQNIDSTPLKRRALTDLLTELKELGVSYRSKPIELLLDAQTIFERATPTLADTPVLGEVKELWDKADAYFFKNIYMLQQLRYVLPECSQDINQSQSARMKGFAETLLYSLMLQRNAVNKITIEHGNLAGFVKILDGIKSCFVEVKGEKPAIVEKQDVLKQWVYKLKVYLDEISELMAELDIIYTSLERTLAKGALNQANIRLLRQSVTLIAPLKKTMDSIFLRSSIAHTMLTVNDYVAVKGVCEKFTELISVIQSFISTTTGLSKSKNLINLAAVGAEISKKFLELSFSTSIQPSNATHSKDTQEFATQFKTLFNDVVFRVQITIQSLKEQNDTLDAERAEVEKKAKEEEQVEEEVRAHKKSEQAKSENEKEGEKEKNSEEGEESIMDYSMYNKGDCIARLKKFYDEGSKKMKLKLLNQKLVALFQLVNTYANTSAAAETSTVLSTVTESLVNLQPLLNYMNQLLKMFSLPFMAYHKALSKLEYVLLNTFANLVKNGYCRKEESEEQKGEGKGATEFVDGTGMDEGEGKEDVSNEIENEDQITDMKDTKPSNKQKDIKEDDNGIEMDQDFEAELQDVDKQEPGEDEEEEEEGDEMDKDMGDIDDDDPNKETLDKKLWDENEENDNDKEEKFDNKTSNTSTEESEIQGKEDQEDGEGEDEEKGKEKQKPKQKEQKKQELEVNEQDPEEVDQDEYQDKMEEEGGEGEDQKNDESNNQEFELPEDINLDDGMDEGSDKEGSDSDSDNEQENAENPEESTTAPLQKQDQEEKEEENIETEDAQKENEKTETANEDDENSDSSDDEKEEIDPSLQDNKNQEKKSEDEQKEGDEEKDDKEDEDEEKEPEELAEKQEASEQNLKETPFGVKQTAGKASEIKEDEDENTAPEEKQMNTGEENGQDVNKQDVGQSWEQGEQKQFEEQQNKEAQKQFDPNPYRSLGDAVKKWKQKLKMVEREEDKKHKEEINEKSKEQQSSEEKEEKNADAFEFMENEQKDPNETQVLAPATKEQANEMPPLRPEEEEEEEEKTEEKQEERKNKKDMQGEDEEDEDMQQDNNSNNNKSKAIPNQMDKKKPEQQKIEEDEEMEDVDPHEILRPQNLFNDEDQKESTIHANEKLVEEEDYDEELAPPQQITMEEIKLMREELDKFLANWKGEGDNVNRGKEIWKRLDMMTSSLAQELCEQLRLILEPTLATKLKGDYKTGKRINMKKIIPYIASQFRKDKIWLRRTKPNKRQYQVLVAVDDSMSMNDNNAGKMACEAVALLCKAMSQLEVGQMAIVSFGEAMRLLHPFDRPFTDDSGSEIVAQFTFNQKQTQMGKFMREAIQFMDTYRSLELASNAEQLQLSFIISDGRILDREDIVKLVRQAHEKRQLFVLILIDNPKPEESVLSIQSVNVEKSGKVSFTSYMDQFPFPYYIILRDIQQLPQVLADALRQWFEIINMMHAETM